MKSSKSAAFKEAVQKIDEYISDPVVSDLLGARDTSRMCVNLFDFFSRFRNIVRMQCHQNLKTLQAVSAISISY